MTKHDYNKLAEVFNEYYNSLPRQANGKFSPDNITTSKVFGLMSFYWFLADKFERELDNFDAYQFKKACKIEQRFK